MASLNLDSITKSTILSSRVRVFHGARALGNVATCFVLEDAPTTCWQLANAQVDGETWCLLWRDAQTVRVVALRGGNAMRFCGHGLVAAGYTWLRYAGEEPLLTMGERSYRTRAQGQHCIFETDDYFASDCDFSIAVPHLDLSPVTLNWQKNVWFDIAPNLCFYIGKDDDYLLCVWPAGIDIALIKINFEFIAKQSRAIVMTQSDTEKFSQYSARNTAFPFNLRYLAPQYGNNEDAATGSAAAIAASFWKNYFRVSPGQNFIVNQRSRWGGEIYCTVDRADIWIGGRVTSSELT